MPLGTSSSTETGVSAMKAAAFLKACQRRVGWNRDILSFGEVWVVAVSSRLQPERIGVSCLWSGMMPAECPARRTVGHQTISVLIESKHAAPLQSSE